MPVEVRFVCYYHFISWRCLSLGAHIYLSSRPNIEIHLPFGFVRLGWNAELITDDRYANCRTFGFGI